jgi:hypothetical protein
VDGDEPFSVPGTLSGGRDLEWLPAGKSLLAARIDSPNVVYEIELASGKRKPFRTIAVP